MNKIDYWKNILKMQENIVGLRTQSTEKSD